MTEQNLKIIPADLSWVNYKIKDINSITSQVKKILKEYKNKIIKIKQTELNFKNLIHYGEEISFKICQLEVALFPFSNLHIDKKFRDASMKVELELSKILSEFVYDEEIYQQFINYYNYNFQTEKSTLTQEEIKIVEDQKKAYDKMGMNLSKKDKKKLLTLRNKITKLAQAFDKNLTKNYEVGTWFTKEELKGIDEIYFKSFKFDKKKNKYFINCSGRDDLGSDYPVVKKFCSVKTTREAVTKINEAGVGEKNNKLLREILKIREEIKNLLKFKTWADLAMDEEMMNKPEDAKIFLQDLINKLQPNFQEYKHKLEQLLKTKKEKLSTASIAYANNLLNQSTITIKEEEYKPYFELNNVLKVLFKTWEELFDIKTIILKNKTILHPDDIFLEFTDIKNNQLLGHGIMDLHPRPGKYGHYCVADIFKKFVDKDGNKYSGLTYLICNFKKAIEGPTFLSLSDMNTFYHEAGHMLHMILMKNNYMSSASTSRDFVEIPSQFHERFLTNEKYIKDNFKHYQTNKEMPEALLNNINQINKEWEIYSWIRTSTSSLFDQEIHSKNILKYTKNKTEIDKLYQNLWKKNLNLPFINKSWAHASKWGHLVGGYDARYYSYVISKVYSIDFWQCFVKHGIKKGEMSEKYKSILEAANKIEEKELVKQYLGREVDSQAFLDSLK